MLEPTSPEIESSSDTIARLRKYTDSQPYFENLKEEGKLPYQLREQLNSMTFPLRVAKGTNAPLVMTDLFFKNSVTHSPGELHYGIDFHIGSRPENIGKDYQVVAPTAGKVFAFTEQLPDVYKDFSLASVYIITADNVLIRLGHMDRKTIPSRFIENSYAGGVEVSAGEFLGSISDWPEPEQDILKKTDTMGYTDKGKEALDAVHAYGGKLGPHLHVEMGYLGKGTYPHGGFSFSVSKSQLFNPLLLLPKLF